MLSFLTRRLATILPTLLFVTINFIVDLLYAFFDPRIRYS